MNDDGTIEHGAPHPFDGCWPDAGRWLAPDVLAEIGALAAAADRDGRPAGRALDLLRGGGWPGLAVPEKFHGTGLTLVECCAVQRALAVADPALAIAVNMHLFSVGLMVEHWRRRTDTSWLLLEAVATQNRLIASAFAEPNLGGSGTRSTLRAEPVDGGWRVSGRKRPCSLAGQADLVCLQVQTAADPSEVLVALLPTTAPGLRVVEDWDTLGMRGSASDTLVIEECFIPKELVFYRAPAGAEDDDVLAAGVIWFALTSTACYLGVARAAMTQAATLLRALRIAHLGQSRASLPSYQATVGDAAAEVLALESACAEVARRMDAGAEPENLVVAALAVKQRAVRVIPAFVGTLAEACGGASYARSLPLERLWRDAQAIRFHPPTPAAARQYLGRRALGLPSSLDLDECAPGLAAAEAAT
ncbi:alkylation response protein AidB-like acyl-CoA dehydrogenase [Thermocatellispora tengchongensis]|uniref:Dibenzothiophene monooxygenase n=1 Tax=Thermocatellispora tengchongensis TaxID=1073253 RepID=A0A840NU72_9ACTN|nr:acyl-CoA dehydrogenase family protein [Thermocatellispora tengchongensis]MBB5132284.1 alkylation response protein AidB-like acyl-CoA dehydrogenase [Thermocatellispora tengchongensis]